MSAGRTFTRQDNGVFLIGVVEEVERSKMSITVSETDVSIFDAASDQSIDIPIALLPNIIEVLEAIRSRPIAQEKQP